MNWDRLIPGLLAETTAGELIKVSNVYENRVTGQVVYPALSRTTVRIYRPPDVATWREPSNRIIELYDEMYGR